MTGLSEAGPIITGHSSSDDSIPFSPDTEDAPFDFHYAMSVYHSDEDDADEPFEDDAVTEEMYARGGDMQGIDWTRQTMPRASYREQRVQDYENYLSLEDIDEINQDPHQTDPPGLQEATHMTSEEFYTFKYAKLTERCSIGHFQLRNLLWATTKDDIYYMYGDTVRQWSPPLCSSRQIMDVSTANSPQSLIIKISSMACGQNILMVGGFMGEYAFRRLDDMTAPVHYGVTTDHANGIANHIHISEGRKGGIKAVVSSNDKKARYIDLDTRETEHTISFPFAVNCSALSPDRNLLCVVGDSTATLVVNVDSFENVMSMDEHRDYSFACCWSPDGRLLATGNQDKTTRVYDIRNTSKALHVLGAKVGAIRSLQFSRDGRHLIAAEPIDFVHVYDTATFESSQVIDMFGDIAGVALTPDDQALYIANSEERIGGIFEFQRQQPNWIDWTML
ncbi:hypothetical protein BCR43DRAFT_495791 [Syncephalastrum racemosum]|uniref:Uncharacterized protein n=1 Tax=Syncephalastrum racemosum TaxID=13706 RepID=A0A1X2H6F0_SYNRA|nr:hypothetical protein BCR43DRAFT_495791 [Syncephalastrum racemosum]